jgi:hypothetical protein
MEIPDGSYTLVPEGGDKKADGDVHYVIIDQDLDQSLEEPKAIFDDQGKP